jgi:hypothetical protein
MPKGAQNTQDNREITSLLCSYYHMSSDAAVLYLRALEEGSVIQNSGEEKPLKELMEKNLLYEPVRGTEIYIAKPPSEQLLPRIFLKIEEIRKLCEITKREWDKGQKNQIGTILKIIEGQDSVDKAVFNLIKNSPKGSEIKLCVRSLSPLGNPEQAAEAILNQDLSIKALLISQEEGEYYKTAVERLKQLRAKGLSKIKLEVKSLPGNQEFRYMVARNKVVFVTGHRAKGMFAEDMEVAKWFEQVFDQDWLCEKAQYVKEDTNDFTGVNSEGNGPNDKGNSRRSIFSKKVNKEDDERAI